jgi:hypothetical protein
MYEAANARSERDALRRSSESPAGWRYTLRRPLQDLLHIGQEQTGACGGSRSGHKQLSTSPGRPRTTLRGSGPFPLPACSNGGRVVGA